MSHMIDVTGLPPDAIRAVESLVRILRESTTARPSPPSIFDAIGKAPVPRPGEDLARQLEEERAGWGEP